MGNQTLPEELGPQHAQEDPGDNQEG